MLINKFCIQYTWIEIRSPIYLWWIYLNRNMFSNIFIDYILMCSPIYLWWIYLNRIVRYIFTSHEGLFGASIHYWWRVPRIESFLRRGFPTHLEEKPLEPTTDVTLCEKDHNIKANKSMIEGTVIQQHIYEMRTTFYMGVRESCLASHC